MLNITRFNTLDNAFENLFRGIPVWQQNAERQAAEPTRFPMDVSENDREYQILAELPGVKKEEISIIINGNEVAVSAEVSTKKSSRTATPSFAPSAITARFSAPSRSDTRSTKRPRKPSTTTACWSLRCRRKPERHRKGSRCIEQHE